MAYTTGGTLLKVLSDVVYIIQHQQSYRRRMVVHFDRLKPFYPQQLIQDGQQAKGPAPEAEASEDAVNNTLPELTPYL